MLDWELGDKLAALVGLGELEELGAGQPSMGLEGGDRAEQGQEHKGPDGRESGQQGQLAQWQGGQQQQDWEQGGVVEDAHQLGQGPWGEMVRSF